MQDVFVQVILGILQGILEWLPVSSSTHLELAAKLFNYDLDLRTTVALHFGTLMAVFVYFGQDITDIIRDISLARFKSPNAKLGFMLIVATIPAAIFGFLFSGLVEGSSGSLLSMSIGLGITSMILFIGIYGRPKKNRKLSLVSAALIGVAQIASLFRGVSRSGSTIAPALLLGVDMKTAVKFSYLLSIPIILGANIVALGNSTLSRDLLAPTLAAFFVGLAGINLSFKYILNKAENLVYFAIYTLILATVLFVISFI